MASSKVALVGLWQREKNSLGTDTGLCKRDFSYLQSRRSRNKFVDNAQIHPILFQISDFQGSLESSIAENGSFLKGF